MDGIPHGDDEEGTYFNCHVVTREGSRGRKTVDRRKESLDEVECEESTIE